MKFVSYLLKRVSFIFFVFSSLYTEASNSVTWGYTGKDAPDHWSSLDKSYFLCSMGSRQSPIDLSTASATEGKSLQALFFDYRSSPLEIENNGHAVQIDEDLTGIDFHGHTIQVNPNSVSSALLGGKIYKLLQFHFHSPSEHTINGKNFPMEAHFVHQNEDGEIAVIGVMIKEGKENPVLKQIFSSIPEIGTTALKKEITINPYSILPQEKNYLHYQGSLTTPPCTEFVEWFVLTDPISVSSAQIKVFHKFYNGNNRPVQELRSRTLLFK